MSWHPVTLRLIGGTPDLFNKFLDELIALRHGERSGLVQRSDGSVHSPDVGSDDFEGDVWEVSTKFPTLTVGMSSRRGRDPWENVVLKNGAIVGEFDKRGLDSFLNKTRSKSNVISFRPRRDDHKERTPSLIPDSPARRPTQVEVVKQGGHVFTIEKVNF